MRPLIALLILGSIATAASAQARREVRRLAYNATFLSLSMSD